MRIYIKEASGRKITLPVPLSIMKAFFRHSHILTRIFARKRDKEIQEFINNIDYRMLAHSLHELRHHKGLKVVELKSSKGDELIIKV